MSEAEAEKASDATEAKAIEEVAPSGHPDVKIPSAQKKHTMHVKVYGPFKIYVDEKAYSISAVNHTGPFDVLGEHHKFITILDACELVVHTLTDTKRIRISRGVMHVSDDSIIVFLDV